MTIRPATPADVPAILPMVRQLADLHESWDPRRFDYRDDVGTMYDHWLRTRAEDEWSVFLVAERESAIVGFLIATMHRTIPIYRLEEVGYIHDLYVDPAYRNEGIARLIVMETLARFRDKGVTQVRLETAQDNHPARTLFAACGFRTSAVEMLAELPPIDPAVESGAQLSIETQNDSGCA